MSIHLPDNWELKPLSCIVTRIESGKSVNAHDRPCKDGEIGVLKLSCLHNGLLDTQHHKAVLAQERSLVSGPVRGDTIIISRKNTAGLVGTSVYSPNDVADLYLSDLLWQLHIDKSQAVPKWLAYLLRSTDVQRRISANASGTSGSMKGITKSSLADLDFHFPPLSEQRRIVEILDEADAAVRLTEALIAANLRHKRAWAERLLTGKVRFPEFAGEAWQTYLLGNLFTERVEAKRPDLKLLAVTGGEGIVDRDTLAKRDTSNADKTKYLRVAPGDIAYNTMRMWQGVFGLSTLEGIVSPAYTVCTPKGDKIEGKYAEQSFKMPEQIAKFHRYSQGLVKDTLNLKFPAFAKIEVTIPPLAEQRKIAEVLGLMDEETALRRRQLAALKAQKQGLMQKLLTGEVRVKEAAP
jgi:type I restriction enzyme S subunit